MIAANYLGFSAARARPIANGTGHLDHRIVEQHDRRVERRVGNVISGNTGDGILIEPAAVAASDNEIFGNLIGTDPAGTVAVGNGQSGIDRGRCSGNADRVCGDRSGNVISGNAGAGIAAAVGRHRDGDPEQRDRRGIDAKTRSATAATASTLNDSPSNQIGGTDYHRGQPDRRPITATGSTPTGNSSSTAGRRQLHRHRRHRRRSTWAIRDNGISLASSSNTIGGTIAGAGNTIDFNGVGQAGSGVQLVGNPDQQRDPLQLDLRERGPGDQPGRRSRPRTMRPALRARTTIRIIPTLSLAQSDGATTTVQGSLDSIPEHELPDPVLRQSVGVALGLRARASC